MVVKDEERVGQTLAQELQANVVRPREITTSGVKNPDYIIDDVAAELVSPKTGNLERFLDAVQKKHQQAGVVVIDLTNSAVPAADVLASTGRLFGRPTFSDVNRIIFVQGTKVLGQAFRPVSFTPTIIKGAIKGTASIGSRAVGGKGEGKE